MVLLSPFKRTFICKISVIYFSLYPVISPLKSALILASNPLRQVLTIFHPFLTLFEAVRTIIVLSRFLVKQKTLFTSIKGRFVLKVVGVGVGVVTLMIGCFGCLSPWLIGCTARMIPRDWKYGQRRRTEIQDKESMAQ